MICPHCGFISLVRDRGNQLNGKGFECLLCGRKYNEVGKRHISERRESKRGCCLVAKEK